MFGVLLSVLSSAALAGEYPVRLHGGLGGISGPDFGAPSGYHAAPAAAVAHTAPSWGGHLVGRITGHFGRYALEAGVREGVVTEDLRSVGAIFAGGRVAFPDTPLHARFGFAHNHETPADIFLAQPLGALSGSIDGIRHRSGLEVGAGVSGDAAWVPVFGDGFRERLGVSVDLAVSWMPDVQGAPLYVFLDVTGSIGVGSRR